MDIFSDLLDLEVNEGRYSPFTKNSFSCSHLLYADDILIFGKTDRSTAASLQLVISKFSEFSGMFVNMENFQAMSKISKLSSAFKILWEALSILTKTWRPLLPIMLIKLLFSTLFFLLNYLSITPILTQVTGTLASLSIIDPKSSVYATILSTTKKELREVTIIEAVILLASFIVSSFITMTIIHLISMACSDKKQTSQELFSVIKKIWKGPMITQLFATILNIAVSFFILTLVIAFIMISIGSFAFTAAGVLLAILAILLCLYVALICSLSIVVSVVEEGCYGLAAFQRSVELTKGRRQIGILIMFATQVGSGIIFTVYNISVIHASSNTFGRLVIGFAYVATLVLMTVLINAANTVFYYECKSYGSGLLAMEGGLEYTSISKEADASIP